jgi:threonine/homoserine/homoserine lactone efflux protein
VHVLAAALGLSAILLGSAVAYGILKYAGAAYLVYLGVRMILTSRQPLELRAVESGGSHATFRQGVLTEALNPKTAIFFFTFLPQFVSPGGNATLQFLLLGSISVALNSTADVVALLAAPLARGMDRNPRWRQAQQAGCGAGLIGLGAYVAVGER